ncbi:helix-turn-helix domain-containing protein [Metapseudomonas otitidis]|uniref:helix-turn-helix domain-containing protein n=1 Tax=Metapseudomonas otitidis TaxID=319939 RepID=UPI001F47AD61|nr:helix-turn-helix domain-containing protein [Pseudomonas otitidis]
MSSIGERLREERERLGFNQTAFGAIGGVQKQAQLKYEKGERSPDADYLAALSKVDVDVLYVVTGQRCLESLGSDESDLLSKFRAAPLAVKAAALAALTAGAAPPSVQRKQVIHGDVGQYIEGPVDQTGITIQVGGGGRKKGK